MRGRSLNDRSTRLATTACVLVVSATVFTMQALAQSSNHRAYLARPMHLEVWPLLTGAEFVPLASSDVVFRGQTCVLRVTLRNLWDEAVAAVVLGDHWGNALQIALVAEDGSSLRNLRLHPQASIGRDIARHAGDVSTRGAGAIEFGAGAEWQIEKRFQSDLPPGKYRVRVSLSLLAGARDESPLPQTLHSETSLTVEDGDGRSSRLEVLYREALLARTDGRLADSEEKLRELLRTSANSSAAHILLANIALARQDERNARLHLEQAQDIVERGIDADSKVLATGQSPGRLKSIRLIFDRLAPSVGK